MGLWSGLGLGLELGFGVGLWSELGLGFGLGWGEKKMVYEGESTDSHRCTGTWGSLLFITTNHSNKQCRKMVYLGARITLLVDW